MRRRITLSLLVCALALVAACAAVAADDPWERLVSIDVKDVTLGAAMTTLMKDTGLDIALNPDVKDAHVPGLRLVAVPLRKALNVLTKVAGAVYRIDNGVLVISRAPDSTDPWSRPVNLDVKEMPLAQVIDTLLKNAPVSYTIDPAISQIKVNAVLRNITLDAAIKQVAKAAGIVYRIEGGSTYLFSARPPVVASPVNLLAGEGETLMIQMIQLRFVDPGDVIPVLQMSGVQVLGSGPSYVLIRAGPEGIEKAERTVKMLDTPDALPRPIRVMLTVTARVDNRMLKASTDGVGAEGTAIPLHLDVSTPPNAKPGVKAPADALVLTATITPTVVAPTNLTSDDPRESQETISLVGSGSIMGIDRARSKTPWLNKTFQIAASLPAAGHGAPPALIASGYFEADGRKVSFDVTAHVVLEQGRVRRPTGAAVERPGGQMMMPGCAPGASTLGPADGNIVWSFPRRGAGGASQPSIHYPPAVPDDVSK